MAAYTIKIKVNSKGNMTYDPSMLRVAAGDTVQWRCPKGSFAVMFKEKSPFTHGMDTRASAGKLSPPLTVDKVKGHYHYAVAIFNGTDVFMDAGCPVLLAN
jgi:plastocyanin